MITFPERISIPILNQVTGRRYELTSAAELSLDAPTLARIVAICNEPEVHRWLFRESLDGRPYPEAMAREWIEWARAGWESKTHFVFAVRDERKVVAAACDIKSNAPNAEIGYWASREHRGIITNAVIAMCELAAEAGFVSLSARTKQGNERSKAVLERAGFKRREDRTGDHDWFTRVLRAERSNNFAQTPPPSRGGGGQAGRR